MKYLKCLLFSILVVFFVNYLTPGIEVMHQTKLPHIGGDLIFSVSLGLLNSLIGPVLRVFGSRTKVVRLSLISLILNFSVYALLRLLPLGIFVTSLEGYLIAAFIVSLASVLLNYWEGSKTEPPKMVYPNESNDHESEF